MIKYAAIKVAACLYCEPVGYIRGEGKGRFRDINEAYRYFEREKCWSFDCGCKFDIKEVEIKE